MNLSLQIDNSLHRNINDGFGEWIVYIKKLLFSILSRLILNEGKRFFNNNKHNFEFYSDTLGAALLLLMSTAMTLITVLLTSLAMESGFNTTKVIILLVIASFAIVTFIEHKKMVAKYTN